MPVPPFSEVVRELLSHPNPAVIATVRPDGQPVSVPTWYDLDGDRILVNMDARRRRLAYLRNDPRVSFTVLDGDNWGTHVSMQGSVVEFAHDEDLSGIDRLATRYTGESFGNRDGQRVNAWIEVEHWNAWDLEWRAKRD